MKIYNLLILQPTETKVSYSTNYSVLSTANGVHLCFLWLGTKLVFQIHFISRVTHRNDVQNNPSTVCEPGNCTMEIPLKFTSETKKRNMLKSTKSANFLCICCAHNYLMKMKEQAGLSWATLKINSWLVLLSFLHLSPISFFSLLISSFPKAVSGKIKHPYNDQVARGRTLA